MAKKVNVSTNAPLRYRGVFDYDGLYAFMKNWCLKRKIRIFESPFKWKASGPGMTEIEAFIKGETKLDEYQKFEIEIMWKAVDMKFFHDEKSQKKMSQGRIHIQLSGTITSDYQNIFGKTPLSKTMGDIINHVLKKDTTKNHLEHFRVELEDFHNEMRQFFHQDTVI
ncbi:MAG: hypothetical protein ACMXYA_01105 [Candidatus Woesearchaeota archaeon]